MSGKESKVIVTLSFLIGLCFVIFVSSVGKSFSLDNYEYTFESSVYKINENYIENISPYTSVELFSKYFDLENCTIELVNNEGKIENNSYVTNGSKTNIYNDKNDIIKTYTNIIQGDYNNDGIINDIDFQEIGKCLVDNCNLTEYQLNSLDIDNDGNLHINDLSLLDKAVTLGYQNISLNKETITIRLNETARLIATITPSYGLNQNVKWISLDENIVTVDETGRIFGNNGGETIIQAITPDNKLVAETKVVVDNSIILESYSGRGYVKGYDTKIHIDLISYEDINCSSANESIATCSIEEEYLIITAHNIGITNITIKGEKYKDAIYKVDCQVPNISSYYRAGCNMVFTPVVGFFAGELEDFTLESSDPEIVIGSSVGILNTGAKALVINYGKKYGRTYLKIRGSTTPQVLGEIMIDHSIMKLGTTHKFTKVGEEVSVNISGENLGQLSCEPNNKDVAECRIEGDQLIVKSLSLGQSDITVYNTFTYEGGWPGNCGSEQFTVFVMEE